jgi:hypothetical protein
MLTDHACPSIRTFGDAERGGLEMLHPLLPRLDNVLREIRGVEFDVHARPSEVVTLPRHLPQIRLRHALRGQLQEFSALGVRHDEALVRGSVRPAADFRRELDLEPEQKLVLILFCRDELLEQLWGRPELLEQIAEGSYDLVVCPSYSLYLGRPRPNHLDNLKRSLLIFEELDRLGVRAVPRVAFVVERDVVRAAKWIEACAVVQVAADLMTYRDDPSWQEQVELLDRLDHLTGRRLHYVVNGPGVFRRVRYLYERIDEERLTLTEATLASPPWAAGAAGDFRLRCARYEEIRRAAAAAARADRRAAAV